MEQNHSLLKVWKIFLISLILFDVFMSVAATVVDWSHFFSVPWYLVPFVPICPLYPLLLALCFAWKLFFGVFPKPLLFFTALGIISYALMAPIFYPLYMSIAGFRWYELGNIFWVFLYGSQIFLIWPYITWPKAKIHSLFAAFFLGGYFVVKDFTDFFLGTFSYQREGMLPPHLAKFFFFSILMIHLGAWVFLITRVAKNTKNSIIEFS